MMNEIPISIGFLLFAFGVCFFVGNIAEQGLRSKTAVSHLLEEMKMAVLFIKQMQTQKTYCDTGIHF